ncbi:MAG: hypothetical protein JSR23_14900 [Proteobacteria bacterium]|nr:hypothetical protein [Pseudomonadota bacterium]
MSDESILPFLSQFDPPQSTEGGLDPLGLYAIADALAVKLAPGVRERQSTPRFLMLSLVGMVVCDGELAELGQSKNLPAWLVYEWMIVESLVRNLKGSDALRGLPGREKVQASLNAGERVRPQTYLKTPTVFGFHGVYRVLGQKVGLFDADGRVLEAGYRLLETWEREQKLNGFLARRSDGGRFRDLIAKGIRAGLNTGYGQEPGAELRRLICNHLLPHQADPDEAKATWDALTGLEPMRGEYATWLISEEGLEAWRLSGGSERRYQQWLLDRCSPQMKRLLTAVQAYEALARLLSDAWDEVRWRMTAELKPVTEAQLAEGEQVRASATNAQAAYALALQELSDLDAPLRLRAEGLRWISECANPLQFVGNLLKHHVKVQQSKPPGGKRSWFDTYSDGSVAIRPAYTLDKFVRHPDRYVHAYRTAPIWSFAMELGMIRITAEA